MAIKKDRRCSVVLKAGYTIRLLISFFLAVMLSGLLSGCSDNEITPEERIKAVVETAVKAVETKELGVIADLIAKSYTDQYGNDRKKAIKMLRLYFFRNRSIYLFTKIKSIELIDADAGQQSQVNQSKAQLKVYVGMAGTPISKGIPVGVRANLFLFDLQMVQEDSEWLVQQASWRRVSHEDIIGKKQ